MPHIGNTLNSPDDKNDDFYSRNGSVEKIGQPLSAGEVLDLMVMIDYIASKYERSEQATIEYEERKPKEEELDRELIYDLSKKFKFEGGSWLCVVRRTENKNTGKFSNFNKNREKSVGAFMLLWESLLIGRLGREDCLQALKFTAYVREIGGISYHNCVIKVTNEHSSFLANCIDSQHQSWKSLDYYHQDIEARRVVDIIDPLIGSICDLKYKLDILSAIGINNVSTDKEKLVLTIYSTHPSDPQSVLQYKS